MIRTLVIALLALSCTTVNAGEKKKDAGPSRVERGPEHKVLEALTGTFDAKAKLFLPDPTKPTESGGVMTRKMILDGNFLQEAYVGEFLKNRFEGQGLVGFDYNKKKFILTWVDSMSTSMIYLEGSYDPAKKTLTMVGEEFDANTKKKMKARDVLRITGDDTQVFEMYRHPEGVPAEMKVMEITYTRKKAK